MELLVLTTAAILFALAAYRWGVDSRPRFISKEHELARRGITWQGQAASRLLPGSGSPFVLGAAGFEPVKPHAPRLYSRHRLLRRNGGRRPRSRLRG
ncbi:MAG: hypothetical protein JO023_21955 [Chloroflexi bacterium]|nr:hypothetical protein [Chloroflexota bacterium]